MGPTCDVPSMTITYSRPSRVNPPKPFQKLNPSGGRAGCSDRVCRDRRWSEWLRKRRPPEARGRSICSVSDPRPPPRTARAAAASRTASSVGTLSAVKKNTPPDLPSISPATPVWSSLRNRSAGSPARSSRITRSNSSPGGGYRCATGQVGERAPHRLPERLGPARSAGHRKWHAATGSAAPAGWQPPHQGREDRGS